MEKSCGIIIYKIENNEIKYLLLHQNNNCWSFPKGHVENNETEFETALRETKEECNLIVKLDNNFRESILYEIPIKNTLKEAVYFIGIPVSNDIKLQEEEITDFKWLNFNDAYNKLEFDNIRNVLIKANKYIGENNEF